MVILILVPVLAALLLAVVWYRRRSSTAPEATTTEAPARPKAFRCVGVDYNTSNCCMAVQQLEGARLLPSEAHLFPLPLPECDAAACTCRYAHYDDRRTEDRRVPFSSLMTAFGRGLDTERRSGQDRRTNCLTEEMRIIGDTDVDIDALKSY